MICSLRGIVQKSELPFLTIDVQGVGYEVQASTSLWEQVNDGDEASIHVHTYVREDRFELFGFPTSLERSLFANFLGVAGVGPRIALQLCSVPVDILCHAVEHEDTRALSSLKGVGKKMAEKILLELGSFSEKGLLVPSGASVTTGSGLIDDDALQALTNLGYDRRTVLDRLRDIPGEVTSTEERVKLVLQSL